MKKIAAIVFFLMSGWAFSAQAQTIYSSAKGQKYHTADCKLSGDAEGMTLAFAKKSGKTSCGICKADDHVNDKMAQCAGKTANGAQCKRMTGSKSGKCFQHKSK